jgi:hypothetical protein
VYQIAVPVVYLQPVIPDTINAIKTDTFFFVFLKFIFYDLLKAPYPLAWGLYL